MKRTILRGCVFWVTLVLMVSPATASDDTKDECAGDEDAGESWTTAAAPVSDDCDGNIHATQDKEDWYVLRAFLEPHTVAVTFCNDGDSQVRFELYHRATLKLPDVTFIEPQPTLKRSILVSGGDCDSLDDVETTPGTHYIHLETFGGDGQVPYGLEIATSKVKLVAIEA